MCAKSSEPRLRGRQQRGFTLPDQRGQTLPDQRGHTLPDQHGHTLPAQRGFTLPELIAVLLMVSILSVTAIPKMQGALSFRDAGWHDQVVASLHYAHKLAIGHRRLICATVSSNGVSLAIASANPATSCSTALPGVDGNVLAADGTGAAAASISPSGTIYFQPTGRVSTDGAGSSTANRTISISGQTNVLLVGETGHVE